MNREHVQRVILPLAFSLCLAGNVYVTRPWYIETNWTRVAYPGILFVLNPGMMVVLGWFGGRRGRYLSCGACAAVIVSTWFIGIPIWALFRAGLASFLALLKRALDDRTLYYTAGMVALFAVGLALGKRRAKGRAAERQDSAPLKQ